MAEATTKQGFEVISLGQVTAKQVDVTPSAQPQAGVAFVESTHGMKGRMKGCCATVNGTVLECKLPRWAQAGDILHWTSYDQ